ncbi:hypothetical protein HMPREF1223_10367 [Pseudomonas aeruginosa str. Stone 130]|nr:hypothetical protein HMPREF1223_10367 [Pseudomonas aeruginosa str. Stone 130]
MYTLEYYLATNFDAYTKKLVTLYSLKTFVNG